MYHICRLCLTSSPTNFQKVVDIDPRCFEVCLPEIELGAINSLVICGECARSVQAAYTFKTKCLETEGIIKNYLREHVVANSEDVDLSDVLSLKVQVDVDAAVKNIKAEVEDVNECSEFIDAPIIKLENDGSLDEETSTVGEPEPTPAVKIETDLSVVDEETLRLRESAIKRHDAKYSDNSKYILLCDICNMSFNTKNNLLEHIGLHFGVKCIYCQKYFKDFVALEAHMIEIHASDKKTVYSCDICIQEFTEKIYLLAHILSHFEKPGCQACQKCFTDATCLKRHMLDAHGMAINFLKKTYEDHKEFDRIYFEVDESQLMESVLRHLEKYKTSSFDLSCKVCEKSFNSKAGLDDHIKLHFRRPKCMICNNFFYNSYCLERHISKSQCAKVQVSHENGNKAAINIQIDSFEDSTKENEHKTNLNMDGRRNNHISNVGNCLFNCRYCDKFFFTQLSLDVHMFAAHEGKIKKLEKPFKCKQCGKHFSKKINLNQHSAAHAYKNREFNCEVCKSEFASKTALKIHRRSHSNKLQHECEICKKKFLKSRSLRAHINRHSFVLNHNC